MCFSPEASFTVSAALAIVGVILIKRFPAERRTLLAFIPLFFAMQQFSEGMLWLAFNDHTFAKQWMHASHYSYVFFAYLFWPIWIPLSFLVAETIRWRRILMIVTLIGGFLHLFYSLNYFFTSGIQEPHIVNRSIQYGESSFAEQLIYGVITMLPFFISSIPGMKILGVLFATSFIVANSLYYYAFASVWCFFASIVSIGLLFTLKKSDRSLS